MEQIALDEAAAGEGRHLTAKIRIHYTVSK